MKAKLLWISVAIGAPLLVSCSGSQETEMTKAEQAHFGGTRPSAEVVAKLQKASETAGAPKNATTSSRP